MAMGRSASALMAIIFDIASASRPVWAVFFCASRMFKGAIDSDPSITLITNTILIISKATAYCQNMKLKIETAKIILVIVGMS